MSDQTLSNWNHGPSKKAILDFRGTNHGTWESVVRCGLGAHRCFRHDGILWFEKPMPIELGFILQRLSIKNDWSSVFAPWGARTAAA